MNKNWELIKSNCTHRSDFIGSGAILLESIFDVVDQLSQLLSSALGYVLRLLSFHMSRLCFVGRLLALLLQCVHLSSKHVTLVSKKRTKWKKHMIGCIYIRISKAWWLNCGHVCAFGLVDEVMSGGKPVAPCRKGCGWFVKADMARTFEFVWCDRGNCHQTRLILLLLKVELRTPFASNKNYKAKRIYYPPFEPVMIIRLHSYSAFLSISTQWLFKSPYKPRSIWSRLLSVSPATWCSLALTGFLSRAIWRRLHSDSWHRRRIYRIPLHHRYCCTDHHGHHTP